MKPGELLGIGISLSRAGRSILFLQVSRDGRIKRLGDGTMTGPVHYLSGKSKPEIFPAVCKGLPAELHTKSGTLALPEPAGDAMVLTIRLTSAGKQQVLEMRYGADSASPPAAVQHFVSMAVTLTDDWYKSMLDSKN